jgi:hypothetical protein
MLLPNQEPRVELHAKQEQGDPTTATAASMLPIRERDAALLTNREHITIDEADALSSRLVDEALTAARISNAEAAFALSLKDESLVRKMRSPHTRERMSHGQMLVLASKHPRFYIELNIALDSRTGWFRNWALELQQRASAFFAIAVGR